MRNIVHVEILLSNIEKNESIDELVNTVECAVETWLRAQEVKTLRFDTPFKLENKGIFGFIENVLLEREFGNSVANGKEITYTFHSYYPNRRVMEEETFEDDNCGDDAIPSFNHWLLPSKSFIGLWENLIYHDGIKENLLRYAFSALSLSKRKVNNNIISCNRLLLLHGPPGSGKTSLCKALAQKIAIRARKTYRFTHLIEINSHSLFSKWFSESGKLVLRIFTKLREIVSDENNMVCVLIDEVESLAYARSTMSGNEPQDAMRVVNALLTQLDSLRQNSNVLIFATSNLASTIDLAFLDRADIKQYIGLPGLPAIKSIYSSIFEEIIRVGIITVISHDQRNVEHFINKLTELSTGLSGRTLRKLPFLAHASLTSASAFNYEATISLKDFSNAIEVALEKHKHDQETIGINTK